MSYLDVLKSLFVLVVVILCIWAVVDLFSRTPIETQSDVTERRLQECLDMGGVVSFNSQMRFSGCKVDKLNNN